MPTPRPDHSAEQDTRASSSGHLGGPDVYMLVPFQGGGAEEEQDPYKKIAQIWRKMTISSLQPTSPILPMGLSQSKYCEASILSSLGPPSSALTASSSNGDPQDRFLPPFDESPLHLVMPSWLRSNTGLQVSLTRSRRKPRSYIQMQSRRRRDHGLHNDIQHLFQIPYSRS